MYTPRPRPPSTQAGTARPSTSNAKLSDSQLTPALRARQHVTAQATSGSTPRGCGGRPDVRSKTGRGASKSTKSRDGSDEVSGSFSGGRSGRPWSASADQRGCVPLTPSPPPATDASGSTRRSPSTTPKPTFIFSDSGLIRVSHSGGDHPPSGSNSADAGLAKDDGPRHAGYDLVTFADIRDISAPADGHIDELRARKVSLGTECSLRDIPHARSFSSVHSHQDGSSKRPSTSGTPSSHQVAHHNGPDAAISSLQPDLNAPSTEEIFALTRKWNGGGRVKSLSSVDLEATVSAASLRSPFMTSSTSIRGKHVEDLLSPRHRLPDSVLDEHAALGGENVPNSPGLRSRWESVRRRVTQATESTKAWNYAIYGYYYLNDDFRAGHPDGDEPAVATATRGICGGDEVSSSPLSLRRDSVASGYIPDDGFGSSTRLKFTTRASVKSLTRSASGDSREQPPTLTNSTGKTTVGKLFDALAAEKQQPSNEQRPSSTKSTRASSSVSAVVEGDPTRHVTGSFSRLACRSPQHLSERNEVRELRAKRAQIERDQAALEKKLATLRRQEVAAQKASIRAGMKALDGRATTDSSPKQREAKQKQVQAARARLERAATSVRPSSPAPLGLAHPSTKFGYKRLSKNSQLREDKWWEVRAEYQAKLCEWDDAAVHRAVRRIQRFVRVDVPARQKRKEDRKEEYAALVVGFQQRQKYLSAQRNWQRGFQTLKSLWRAPDYQRRVRRVQASVRRLLSQTRLIRQLLPNAANSKPRVIAVASSFSSANEPTSPPPTIASVVPAAVDVRSRRSTILSLLRGARDFEHQKVRLAERRDNAAMRIQLWWRTSFGAQRLTAGYFMAEEARYRMRSKGAWLCGAGVDNGLFKVAVNRMQLALRSLQLDHSDASVESRIVVESAKFQHYVELHARQSQQASCCFNIQGATSHDSHKAVDRIKIHSGRYDDSRVMGLFNSLLFQYLHCTRDEAPWLRSLGMLDILDVAGIHERLRGPLPVGINAGAFVKARREHSARVIQNTIYRDHYAYRRCARKPLKAFLLSRVDVAVAMIQRAWRRYIARRDAAVTAWRRKQGLLFDRK